MNGSKAVGTKDTPPCSQKVARVAALIGKSLAPNIVAQDSEGWQDAYKPGEFNEIYQKFLKDKKNEGHTHHEAMTLWKSSVIRERLLFGMSESQRKKRRFDWNSLEAFVGQLLAAHWPGVWGKSVQKNTASIPPVNVLSERFANDMACSPFV